MDTLPTNTALGPSDPSHGGFESRIFLADIEAGESLFLRRQYPDGKFLWNCVGGSANAADHGSPRATIIRETEEEVGLLLQPCKLVYLGFKTVWRSASQSSHNLHMFAGAYAKANITRFETEDNEVVDFLPLRRTAIFGMTPLPHAQRFLILRWMMTLSAPAP